ncbi:MAG: hypothetical protein R3F60_14415 [bacterium]
MAGRRRLRLLRAARLGQQWPDARRIASHLEAMSPAIHHGLAPPAAPDPSSGLPGFVHWQQVVSDQSLAAEALASLDDEATLAARVAARGLPIDARQLARRRYAQALVDRPSPRSSPWTPASAGVDGDTADLLLVLDKLETSGRFVRVTVAPPRPAPTAWCGWMPTRPPPRRAAARSGLSPGAAGRGPAVDHPRRSARLDHRGLERGAVGLLWVDGLNWPEAWAASATPARGPRSPAPSWRPWIWRPTTTAIPASPSRPASCARRRGPATASR